MHARQNNINRLDNQAQWRLWLFSIDRKLCTVIIMFILTYELVMLEILKKDDSGIELN